MKRSYLIAGVIAVAVAVWLATGLVLEQDAGPEGAQPREEAAQPPAVQVVDAAAEPHVRRLSLFGRTEADRTVTVKAETDGRVEEKIVDRGQIVAEGDALVRLDLEDREARLREAKALVEQWQAMAQASKSLASSGYGAELKSAEDLAALEGARARLQQIEIDIARTTMAAPFAGIVHDMAVEEGDYLDRFDVVATIVDLDPIKIVAEVTERDAGQISVGSEAAVRLVTGETVEGTVTYVARSAHPGTRTFEVEIDVPNPDAAISEGVTAEVALQLDKAAAHLVSPAILSLDDSGRIGVKLVDERNTVVFRPVKVIDDTPAGMWVAGLPDQARIITTGQEFVRAGQHVRPVAQESAAMEPDGSS